MNQGTDPRRPTRRPTRRAGLAAGLLAATAAVATFAQAPQAGSAARAAPPPAVEAFFGDPLLSSAALSPNGYSVALLAGPKGGKRRLGVLDLRTMKLGVAAGMADAHVAWVRWVNDERLVFGLDQELTGPGRADFGPGLYAVNADGSGFRQLVASARHFVQDGGSGGVPMLPIYTHLVSPIAQGGGSDVFVARPEEISSQRVGYFELNRLNTSTGRAQEVSAPKHSDTWIFNPQGDLRATLSEFEGRGALHLRQADGSFKQVDEFDLIEGGNAVPRYVAPDGSLYGLARQGDKTAVFRLDAGSGRILGPALAASADFDLQPRFIANDQQLLGLRYTVDAEVTQWLTPEMKALQERVDQMLPGTSNRLSVPRRGDSPWVLVEAFADVQPTVAYALQRETGKLTRLGSSLPGIDRRQMGFTDFVKIRARDGQTIPAYLTLPPGGGRKLPLVVLVHGGPWVRGGHWAFDPEVQFLASRGYAVLQPEFRGSAGFGKRHLESGFREWGGRMQDDVTDATRWAVAQGHADEKRICIAGASYGGYATLMGLAREGELYRCGVAWVGVTDPTLMFSSVWSDIREEAKRYGLARMLGDPQADAEKLKAASPLAQAARITQPLLLAYGAWDTRVQLVHGERLRDALAPHNKQVEWVVYGNEGHGWARPENRIDFWTRVERFLQQHLGARAGAAP